MRKAFTMIELIFVIVILGILASVAIPKLSATRDDAKVSKSVNDIDVAMSEISSYVLSQGKVESDLSLMSNTLVNLKNLNLVAINTADRSANIKIGAVDDCVKVQVINSAGDENLTVSFGAAGSDIVCNGVQSKINEGKYSISIRGNIVEF